MEEYLILEKRPFGFKKLIDIYDDFETAEERVRFELNIAKNKKTKFYIIKLLDDRTEEYTIEYSN